MAVSTRIDFSTYPRKELERDETLFFEGEDSRELYVLLLGALGIWALLEIILISRREGAWEKPQAPAWAVEILGIAITLVVMAIVVWAHPWIAGIPLL